MPTQQEQIENIDSFPTLIDIKVYPLIEEEEEIIMLQTSNL